MTDSVNMSLDEIIERNQQNRPGRTRGRGGGNIRGRGGGRGRGRGGRGGGGGDRSRSQSRGRSDAGQNRSRSRSRSRGPRGRSQSRGRSQQRGRSQSRARSRSQQRRFSYPRTRSRSAMRSMTPKGRAGFENPPTAMPGLVRSNRGRGGIQTRLRRFNSVQQTPSGIHSRLGISSQRGRANNIFTPLAVAKRGISKRGVGLSTRNRFSNIGLRSDQILKQQHQNSVIRSQTFTRSRNNSFSSASQLTVSVANDFAKRRRNSAGNAGYLNRQTLASFDNEFGGYNTRRGPGSVKSVGSNRSNKSNRSNRSNMSNRSNLSNMSNQSNSSRKSNQSRGRGRGRGGNRGVGRKFVNKQTLNPKLQKEIAAIQGKSYGVSNNTDAPSGINFTPTPAATQQTLHQRFATA